MCKAEDCTIYLAMFTATLERRRKAVWLLSALLVIGALVGLALLLSTLILGNVSGQAGIEGLKAASGLLVSAFSVGTAKEVLDRWTALTPFEVVTTALKNCDLLPALELEAHWAIAKELAKKV